MGMYDTIELREEVRDMFKCQCGECSIDLQTKNLDRDMDTYVLSVDEGKVKITHMPFVEEGSPVITKTLAGNYSITGCNLCTACRRFNDYKMIFRDGALTSVINIGDADV